MFHTYVALQPLLIELFHVLNFPCPHDKSVLHNQKINIHYLNSVSETTAHVTEVMNYTSNVICDYIKLFYSITTNKPIKLLKMY